MASITYTDHLKLRLKIRRIPEKYPEEIYKNSEQTFFDNLQKTGIAIKKLNYNRKLRSMMIAYNKKNGDIEIVTIHPIKDEKVINRIMSGRWSKNE